MKRATIGITVTTASPIFQRLLKMWPGIKYGILSQIGYEGRRELYETQLRGQIIDLRKYPYDKRGRRTVSYSIGKGMKSVKIAAYPLNLYHPEEVYSSATGVVQSRVERALAGYDERILQQRLEQLDKEGR